MLINEILSDENSLILLDEPDAHLHIERKKEIKKLITDSKAFTILTTHSPTLLNNLNEENIFIFSNKDSSGVNVFQLDKPKGLEEITGGEFSLIDATLIAATEKDILLVEGKNDYNYLTEALKRFEGEYPDFNYLIINCGGADNVPVVLEQSVLPILGKNQLCVCTFDEDDNGKKGKKKVEEIKSKNPDKNITAITHPRYEGFPSKRKEFFMEDYFAPSAYKNILKEDIEKATSFKNVQDLSKAKTIIEKNYINFKNEEFEHFKVILDKLMEFKKDFRS